MALINLAPRSLIANHSIHPWKFNKESELAGVSSFLLLELRFFFISTPRKICEDELYVYYLARGATTGATMAYQNWSCDWFRRRTDGYGDGCEDLPEMVFYIKMFITTGGPSGGEGAAHRD
ncbi:hypothetical protein Tco_0449112 [Tanacetum coccineum]